MPHDPPFETHYSVLGLDGKATSESVRRTYQALFRRHSNDPALLSKLKIAHDVLTTSITRAQYDTVDIPALWVLHEARLADRQREADALCRAVAQAQQEAEDARLQAALAAAAAAALAAVARAALPRPKMSLADRHNAWIQRSPTWIRVAYEGIRIALLIAALIYLFHWTHRLHVLNEAGQ